MEYITLKIHDVAIECALASNGHAIYTRRLLASIIDRKVDAALLPYEARKLAEQLLAYADKAERKKQDEKQIVGK